MTESAHHSKHSSPSVPSVVVLTDDRLPWPWPEESPVAWLTAEGLHSVCVTTDPQQWVHKVVHHAPDVVLALADAPRPDILQLLQVIGGGASLRPLLLLCAQVSPQTLQQAAAAGVHVCMPWSHAKGALRDWVQWAQASAVQAQRQRQTLDELTHKLQERKTVERAKGILMHARQMSDEEAFRLLRTVSMHANQRLVQVSEHVIASAQRAECVNRSGQLRMLSQRVLKLVLVREADVWGGVCQSALDESVQRVEAHLAWLHKKLPMPGHTAELATVQSDWDRLRSQLDQPLSLSVWRELEADADALLQHAEALTAALEQSGHMAPLRVLNIAGRQRMWSQRFAQLTLQSLLGLASADTHERHLHEARHAFETGLSFLNNAPLSNLDIKHNLETAHACWRHMLPMDTPPSRQGWRDRVERLAQSSESVLDVFETLSAEYERSLDMLMG